jgi:hypothetical protein
VVDFMDIFELLKYILSFTYISDLRAKPYNTKAKLILERLHLGCYSLNHIRGRYYKRRNSSPIKINITKKGGAV